MKKCRIFTFVVLIAVALFTGCTHVPSQIVLGSVIAEKALIIATAQIGKPYVYGGRGPEEFDCSGLIVWSYKKAYPNLRFRDGNRIVTDVSMNIMWRYNVEKIPLTGIEPGDVIFITDNEKRITHGGLFVCWLDEKNFKMVHASSADHKQKVDFEEWPIEGRKRDQWFVGAGKLKSAY